MQLHSGAVCLTMIATGRDNPDRRHPRADLGQQYRPDLPQQHAATRPQ